MGINKNACAEASVLSQQASEEQTIILHDRDAARAVVAELAARGVRELSLLSKDMESTVYDQQPFLEAVSRLLRSRTDARFRIILTDSRLALQHGHRLIELSRRLNSRIHFRRPPAEYRHSGETFLLCDEGGFCYRPLQSRYEGTAGFNDPAMVAKLNKRFNELWDRSEPDSELRLLGI